MKSIKNITLFLLMLSSFFNLIGADNIKRILLSPNESNKAIENKAHIKIVYFDGEINFQKTMLQLVDIVQNDQVHGVLLVIDNCGGRTTNYFMLHDLIKKVSAKKPVVAFVSGAALSGGYALASAAHYIVAGNFSELGNIGVVNDHWKHKESTITVVNGSKTINATLDVELFRAGEFKDLGNPYRTLTAAEKEYIQESINKIYQQSLTAIAHNRSLNIDDYKLWAEGKVFLAPEALQLGLIDEIGTILEAEHKLLELISQKNPSIICNQEIYYISAA